MKSQILARLALTVLLKWKMALNCLERSRGILIEVDRPFKLLTINLNDILETGGQLSQGRQTNATAHASTIKVDVRELISEDAEWLLWAEEGI